MKFKCKNMDICIFFLGISTPSAIHVNLHKKQTMSFEVEGKITEIFNTQEISEKFRKREFVIEHTRDTGSYQFTDYIKFQLTQDKCEILDNYQKGQDVKVSFNLSGRKYEKNGETLYFTNLNAWRIETQQTQASQSQTSPEYTAADAPPQADYEDDLPF